MASTERYYQGWLADKRSFKQPADVAAVCWKVCTRHAAAAHCACEAMHASALVHALARASSMSGSIVGANLTLHEAGSKELKAKLQQSKLCLHAGIDSQEAQGVLRGDSQAAGELDPAALAACAGAEPPGGRRDCAALWHQVWVALACSLNKQAVQEPTSALPMASSFDRPV